MPSSAVARRHHHDAPRPPPPSPGMAARSMHRSPPTLRRPTPRPWPPVAAASRKPPHSHRPPPKNRRRPWWWPHPTPACRTCLVLVAGSCTPRTRCASGSSTPTTSPCARTASPDAWGSRTPARIRSSPAPSFTCNIDHPNICMRMMVRFAHGPKGDNIGFHEIPKKDGVPIRVGRATRAGALGRMRPPSDGRRRVHVGVRRHRHHRGGHRLGRGSSNLHRWTGAVAMMCATVGGPGGERSSPSPNAPRASTRHARRTSSRRPGKRRSRDPVDQPVVAHIDDPDDRGIAGDHRARRCMMSAELCTEASGDLFDDDRDRCREQSRDRAARPTTSTDWRHTRCCHGPRARPCPRRRGVEHCAT